MIKKETIEIMTEDIKEAVTSVIHEICFMLFRDAKVDNNKKEIYQSCGAPITDSIETDPVNNDYIFVEN